MLLSGDVQQTSEENASITHNQVEEKVLSAEAGKKRKATEQKVLPKRRAKTGRSSKRSGGLLTRYRTNSKNSEITEPITDVTNKTDDDQCITEEHRGHKARKNRKRATADRVVRVKSSSRNLRVQKDQILNGTHSIKMNQVDESGGVADNVENDNDEMDDNKNQNGVYSNEIQMNRRKYSEELAFNAPNEVTMNIYEASDQENGINDSEKDSDYHGSDYTTRLDGPCNDIGAVILEEDYNDPNDDTGYWNEGEHDYGGDDTVPSNDDYNDPGAADEDSTSLSARLVSCVYCSGVFGSYPQWLGHALQYHPGKVQRDPQRNDGIKRTCPYCPGNFWRADRLLRYEYRSSPRKYTSTAPGYMEFGRRHDGTGYSALQLYFNSDFYHPHPKDGKGNVLTRVCLLTGGYPRYSTSVQGEKVPHRQDAQTGQGVPPPPQWLCCERYTSYGLFTLSVSGTPEPGQEKMGCMEICRMFHITQEPGPHCFLLCWSRSLSLSRFRSRSKPV